MFTISTFKTAIGQGSRPNSYQITFASPPGLSAPTGVTNWELLCKAAAVPALTIGVVEIPIQGGRRIKVPGDRTYAEWTATFIADKTHNVRKYFERWIGGIVGEDFDTTSRTNNAFSGDYKSNITVQQLDIKGNAVLQGKYILKDAFPTDISAIDLSYDTTDTIEEFSVTFQFSYYTNQ
jgi:hypothetical protein